MDWVREYYTEQARTFGSSDITDYHRTCAAVLTGAAGGTPRTVLDLGCGNGAIALVLARGGASVMAVELNEVDAKRAAEFSAAEPVDLNVINADFYSVDLKKRFDLVYCWDGFGVGDDDDQQRLLRRIAADWLQPAGKAVIDVFSPDYWIAMAGTSQAFRDRTDAEWRREIRFDEDRSRMIDQWKTSAKPSVVRSQSLRCYAPAEFAALAESGGLTVCHFLTNRGDPLPPSQWPDYLPQSTSYLAVLRQ